MVVALVRCGGGVGGGSQAYLGLRARARDMMIDLSLLEAVGVDPAARTARAGRRACCGRT